MYCTGEKCGICGEPATHKVSEVVFDDDPDTHRHPLTSYVCYRHFRAIMGSGPMQDRTNVPVECWLDDVNRRRYTPH